MPSHTYYNANAVESIPTVFSCSSGPTEKRRFVLQSLGGIAVLSGFPAVGTKDSLGSAHRFALARIHSIIGLVESLYPNSERSESISDTGISRVVRSLTFIISGCSPDLLSDRFNPHRPSYQRRQQPVADSPLSLLLQFVSPSNSIALSTSAVTSVDSASLSHEPT